MLTYDLMKTDYFCLLDNTIDVDDDFNLKFDVEADLYNYERKKNRIVKVPPEHILNSFLFLIFLSIKNYVKS